MRALLPEEQVEAAQKLNQLTGVTGPAPDPSAADALWSAIETEQDERKRQELIREYLLVIAPLELEERTERFSKLNARFGAQ